MAPYNDSPSLQRAPVPPSVSYPMEVVAEPGAVETATPVNAASSSSDIRARAVALLGMGLSDVETRHKLVAEFGMKHLAAAQIVKEVRTTENPHNGARDMLAGALWCIGGIVVTMATYEAAGPGDTFIIAWGAILFGALQFFKGLVNLAA